MNHVIHRSSFPISVLFRYQFSICLSICHLFSLFPLQVLYMWIVASSLVFYGIAEFTHEWFSVSCAFFLGSFPCACLFCPSLMCLFSLFYFISLLSLKAQRQKKCGSNGEERPRITGRRSCNWVYSRRKIPFPIEKHWSL